jgi:sensor histidine kinase YesM
MYTRVSGSLIFFVFTLFSFTSSDLDSYLYTIGKGVFITAIIITVYETIFYFQLWKASLLESERLKKAQARLQFESLKNQVNPHFLFNSLNTLSSLIHTDADRAEKFIQEFAKTYRYVLDMKDQTFVPLEDELAFVRSYIYLQKIRFDDQLVFENKITSDAEKYFIPPLVLQNLVENCIKHNVVSEKQPLTIELAIRNQVLVVKNNFQEKIGQLASTKTGLENIRQRLGLVTDKKARFYESSGYFYAEIPLIESD